MKCYHVLTDAQVPPSWDIPYHATEGANGWLVVHDDFTNCPDPATRTGHILDSTAVIGATFAAILAPWGVATTDTVLQAVFKIASQWSAAYP